MRRTILIADDKDYNRRTLCEVFERRGYRVEVVKDGFEAVEFCRAMPVTLGVFDYYMPRMTGVDAMKELRRLHYSAPIVITTSARNVAVREDALTSGAQGFFIKPVDVPDLLGLVRNLIGEETAITVRTMTTGISVTVQSSLTVQPSATVKIEKK